MTGGLDAAPPPAQIGIGAAAYAPDGRDSTGTRLGAVSRDWPPRLVSYALSTP